MLRSFPFYSHVHLEVIPHLIPLWLFPYKSWSPNPQAPFVNVVNCFAMPARGVGFDFWYSLSGINKRIYGFENEKLPDYGGHLPTAHDLWSCVTAAKGYLWVADKVAMSFAPLEAAACGCPLIVPNNMDWPLVFEHKKSAIIYQAGSAESLRDALAEYEKDHELQKNISRNALAVLEDKFSVEQFHSKWSRILYN
jgi:hypothetical protein